MRPTARRRRSTPRIGSRGPEFRLGRPIAPVAHRTERSAPDRKAAGSIPARRTSKPDETPPNGFSRVSCPAVFLQHPLDQAIEPLGLEVDVGGQHTDAFVVRTVRFFYLLAQSLDP